VATGRILAPRATGSALAAATAVAMVRHFPSPIVSIAATSASGLVRARASAAATLRPISHGDVP
jgi:hypothetical protein